MDTEIQRRIISDNLTHILDNIEHARLRSPFKQQVDCVIVTKSVPATTIKLLCQSGYRAFAESYSKILQEKQSSLTDSAIIWHFIGPIQSNKIKSIANNVQWVQSMAKIDHALLFARHRLAHLEPLNTLIQVNLSEEKHKHGLHNLPEIINLANIINSCQTLRLRGLMAIASNTNNVHKLRTEFSNIKNIFNQLNQLGYNLDTLSMGMSTDYQLAIECGATMIRIGKSIFEGIEAT